MANHVDNLLKKEVQEASKFPTGRYYCFGVGGHACLWYPK